MKKITIIGAGIGGLTTAIALKQQGFEIEIFENSSAFKKAGSGINLAINAMQVYKKLGVYDDILQNANYTNSMKARTKNLGILTAASFKKFEEIFHAKTVAIHRATLHKILVKHIGNSQIHLNKKLKHLEQSNGKVYLFFEDGTRNTAEILIGADGIHSAVRKSIFDNTELRDAEQICWRGISTAKIDKKYKEELNEIWGQGNRFGFVPITDEKIYWFALIDKKDVKNKEIDLTAVFSDYHQIVKDIIKSTRKNEIICNEIWDLKPMDQWYKENVCLLGDSGHATTPNMGQGAGQAIESAMALSICLKEESNATDAFKKYQNIRFKKVNHIIKTSWMIGKLAQSNNSIVCMMRNFILKMTPKFMTEKQSERVLKLNF